MRVIALVALLPALAAAQFLPPGRTGAGGGGGTTPDPARDDTASSYNATGPNGVKTAPQSTPGALGACAALAGGYASARAVGETVPGPYFCDGVAWRRVYTDADGVLPNADVVVPGYAFVAQAPAGAVAFRVGNNGAAVDFGSGGNDHVWSDGSQLISEGSLRIQPGQSLSVNILGSSSGGLIQMYPGSWVVLQGVGALATCDATSAGGVIRLTADGRLYQCDGTAAYRLTRALPVDVTLTVPTLTGGGEATLTTPVSGALPGEHVTVNMACDLPDIGIRRLGVWAPGVVSIVVANGDQATSQPPTPTACHFVGEVRK